MNRLSRFLAMMKIKAGLEEMAPGDDSIIVSDKSILKVGYPRNERVILEDFAFKLDQRKEMSQNVKSLAIWINKYAIPKKGPFKYTNENLENRLAILSNTRFKDFVHLSTEIITRIRIGDTGTVETGALWTQELLPSDSLLYSLALAKDIQYPEGNDLQKYSATQSIKFLHGLVEKSHILQMGGDETVGRGLVNICYMKGKSKKMELHPRRFQNHD
jgi:CRISPR type III-B/RAMP module RAMP protein Cmr4